MDERRGAAVVGGGKAAGVEMWRPGRARYVGEGL